MIGSLSAIPLQSSPVFLQVDVKAAFSPDGKPGAERQIRPARVLVVEDDYFVSMEIESTVTEIGCEVVGVSATAEEAMRLATRERPDLVLMDVRLAGSLDGIDAAIDIYTRLGIRSLFITAHSDPDTRRRGERANPIGWASKPFNSHQLRASLEAALDSVGLK